MCRDNVEGPYYAYGGRGVVSRSFHDYEWAKLISFTVRHPSSI